MIILFKYCADFENYENFKSFSLYIYIYIYIYRQNKNKIKYLFKYCADVKSYERFKGSTYNIYMYIYIDEVNSALSIIYNLTNSMYLTADKFSDPKKLTMIVKN